MDPVLVVGTALRGSTMVSKVMRPHPQILSVAEFFATQGSRAFIDTRLCGEEMCRRLTSPDQVYSARIQSGSLPAEILYRFGPPATRPPTFLHC